MTLFRTLVLCVVTWLPTLASADTFLLMAEEEGCYWCDRWNSEIADIYPKTQEGQSAPLRRYDIANGAPQGVVMTSRVHFTPTFILVMDDQEIDRIEGYPGEDFFWGLLGMMLERAAITLAETG